jgi:hypothetical protein
MNSIRATDMRPRAVASKDATQRRTNASGSIVSAGGEARFASPAARKSGG